MASDLVPPLTNAERAAVQTALERTHVSLDLDALPEHGPWARAAIVEATDAESLEPTVAGTTHTLPWDGATAPFAGEA
jgi:hypothetical protein